MENGLQQAYLSGVAEGVHQMEALLYLVKTQAPRNLKLQREISRAIMDFKKSVAEGLKSFG